MTLKDLFRFGKSYIDNTTSQKGVASENDQYSLSNWSQDTYEGLIIQRNFLILISLFLLVAVAISVLTIGYIKSTQTIEPFVIEIERKTGVPTVVDPISVERYSSDEAIKRYFIMKYIRAREEYIYGSYKYNYYTVVRVLSSSDVYYSDYKSKASPLNKNSLYSTHGENYSSTVNLKSLIFQTPNSAQVRIKVVGSNNITSDKIVYMEFKFDNIKMNDDERLINPLGFVVTLYRIADENI